MSLQPISILFGPDDIIGLRRAALDEDSEGAYAFLKKAVYRKLLGSQENRLKSHLDGERDPAGAFQKTSK